MRTKTKLLICVLAALPFILEARICPASTNRSSPIKVTFAGSPRSRSRSRTTRRTNYRRPAEWPVTSWLYPNRDSNAFGRLTTSTTRTQSTSQQKMRKDINKLKRDVAVLARELERLKQQPQQQPHQRRHSNDK